MKSKSMTIISIAHRLSTIRRSENIIVLGHDGSVVEMGKFKDLFGDTESELSKLLSEKSDRPEKTPETPEARANNGTAESPDSSVADKQAEEAVEAAQEELNDMIENNIMDENAIEEVVKDVTSEGKPVKMIR